MAEASTNLIVLDVGLLILEIVIGVVPRMTVNAAAGEKVDARSSSKVKVSVTPSVANVGMLTVLSRGPVLSIVERFVTT